MFLKKPLYSLGPDISCFGSPAHNRCTAEFHRNHLKLRVRTGSMYGPVFNRPLSCQILPHLARGKNGSAEPKLWSMTLFSIKKVIFLMRKAPVCFLWLCHNPAVSNASLCHKDVGLEEARTNTGSALKRTAPHGLCPLPCFSQLPGPHPPRWCYWTFPQPPLLTPSCSQPSASSPQVP